MVSLFRRRLPEIVRTREPGRLSRYFVARKSAMRAQDIGRDITMRRILGCSSCDNVPRPGYLLKLQERRAFSIRIRLDFRD